MKLANAPQNSTRYAAKLLFQYRFDVEPERSYRLVEERIIVLSCESSSDAYDIFTKRGRSEERKFQNDEGEVGYFEFVGIREMIHLGIECEDDEVWYSIRKMISPMERREKLIQDRSKLSAIRNEKKSF